jgi:predicted N-acetyltransferase YhbS
LTYIIEPLGPHHDRGAFCCGNATIDAFCRDRALKDHERFKVRVQVACEEGSSAVVGFYSLCVSTLEANRIFGLKKFGKRPIPALYLAMVGVTQKHAGNGLGGELMRDAFKRTLYVAENAGAYCLWLQAVDEEKAAFYEHLQFERITKGKLDMFIAIDTIRDALTP